VKSVLAGGWILYNGDEFPADCEREGVQVLARPFTEIANDLGDARVGNMVMLGALLAITGVLQDVNVDAALERLVKNPRWTELNRRALARGRELMKMA
jgi:Pyruvate/2-oxoacid:ferredoxin oxidoreductase gamma subunit